MEAVAGVFSSTETVRNAYESLRRAGYSPDDINVLTPGSSEAQVHSVPTSSSEQPGMGTAIGGVVGAALGIAGGMQLGTAAAVALIPGVGPVLATGLAAAALLGVGGAVGGAAIGSKAEEKSTPGLPADEIFFYEDALRQGRTVIIVMANGKGEADRARELLAEAGADTLDAAREAWWIGLRDAEAEEYQQLGEGADFNRDQAAFRAGFEAALRRELRGKAWDSASGSLKPAYPDLWNNDAFRRGFERGQEYLHRQEAISTGARWYGN